MRVLISAKQLKDRTQNILYSPWQGTKNPPLCFMPKLVSSCLTWLFYFISPFSHFSDWIFSLELREGLGACRFFANKRQGTAGRGLSLGRPLRVLLSFTSGSGHTRWCLEVVADETRGARLDQVLGPKDLAMLIEVYCEGLQFRKENKKRRKKDSFAWLCVLSSI